MELDGVTGIGAVSVVNATKLAGTIGLRVTTVADVTELADAVGLSVVRVAEVTSELAGATVENVADVTEFGCATEFGVVTVADVTELEGAAELACDYVLDAVADDECGTGTSSLGAVTVAHAMGHARVAGFGVATLGELSKLADDAEVAQAEQQAEQRLLAEGAHAQPERIRAFAGRQGQPKWWDGFIVLLLVMNLVLVPLHLGFFPTTGIEWALYSLYSDFMLLADMLLNFRTGIDDRKQGIVIMDPAEIKQHYLKGWFPVDLLSSLPLDFIIWTWPTKHHRNLDIRSRLSQLAKLLSFVKLIKISRLFRYGGRTEQIMFYQTTGVYLQLGNILALIFLAVHWHACLQFFVGNLMGFPPQSWISIAKLQDKHWWEQYSWAVHNTVSLMMTNNYGLAQKTGLLVEEWIQVMGMFFGALWQALLLGYGANLLAHKDFTKNVQRERMQEVEEFMSYYDLPEWLRARIRSHLNAQQMYLHDKDILSSLSGTLREEVLRHNYSATLTRVPFFAQADPDFTNAIAERLNAEYYQPRDVIARRGTMGQKVYFVRSGVANALSEKQELLDTYTTGDYFGQSCLMGAKVRQDNVVAANHCSVLTLLATDFHEVMGRFPSVRGIFQTLLFEMNSQEHAERRRLQLMRRTKSPTSSGGGCLAVPNTSHTPSTCQLSPPLEETDDSPSAADSGRENRDPEDQGRRDGSDVGGRGSQCKQS
ncbi:potassium/sodium hyperpolarization-activated cyclic nucleotide-gated channel 3-like isoform X2 [Dermacentor andersoni]|uniref:potassium/sodium hyperpolarization-activated cyclic nucleotide-gated channel 3-like isoform X2 n=1 Tax=Dermacentor andersoni TaxID=34620 RepID=UPI002416AEE6|nr:potassium/sodium hyperpolarization-activated cyclic nucleotide-gated channel 1-like isoform X1 [Dermacentor andersoni]